MKLGSAALSCSLVPDPDPAAPPPSINFAHLSDTLLRFSAQHYQ